MPRSRWALLTWGRRALRRVHLLQPQCRRTSRARPAARARAPRPPVVPAARAAGVPRRDRPHRQPAPVDLDRSGARTTPSGSWSSARRKRPHRRGSSASSQHWLEIELDRTGPSRPHRGRPRLGRRDRRLRPRGFHRAAGERCRGSSRRSRATSICAGPITSCSSTCRTRASAARSRISRRRCTASPRRISRAKTCAWRAAPAGSRGAASLLTILTVARARGHGLGDPKRAPRERRRRRRAPRDPQVARASTRRDLRQRPRRCS